MSLVGVENKIEIQAESEKMLQLVQSKKNEYLRKKVTNKYVTFTYIRKT